MNFCLTPRWGFLLLIGVCFVLFPGCGGPDRLPIEGAVSLDGETVDEGAIAFIPVTVEVPEGENAIKVGGQIVEGRYTIPAEKGPYLGKYKVLVFWDKKTGKTYIDSDSEEEYPERKEAMPDIYRDQDKTPLEVDFVAGKTEYDFDITSSE